MTFSDADELAITEFEVAEDAVGRLVGTVGHVMNKHVNDKKHTVAAHKDIYPKVTALLGGKHDLASQAMQIARKNLCYYLNPLTGHYH